MRELLIFCLFISISGSAFSSLKDSLLNELPDTFDFNNTAHYINLTFKYLGESGKLETARFLIEEGLKKSEKDNDKVLETRMLYCLGDYYYYKQNYPRALDQYLKVLPVFELETDTLMTAKTLNSIGLIYRFQNENQKSLEYYFKEIQMLEKADPANRTISKEKLAVLNNVLNHYLTYGQYKKIIEYAPKTIELAKKLGDSTQLGPVLNLLGLAYKNLNEFDESFKMFNEAKRIYGEKKDTFRQAFIILNMGGLYKSVNLIDSALKCDQQSLKMFRDAGYVNGILQATTSIAKIYTKQKRLNEARKLYISSIDTSLAYHFNEVVLNSYSDLSELEYNAGNYKRAYDLKKLYNNLKDSLTSLEKDKQYAELQTKFETLQKENEINQLKTEKKTRDIELQRNKLMKRVGFSVAFILLVFSYISVFFYNQKRKANKLLVEKNDQIELKNEQLIKLNEHIVKINDELKKSQIELTDANNAKNRFFSILAHDLRNPFHSIMGESYLLSKSYDKLTPEERKKYSSDIFDSCEQVNRLLENLLEWIRTQSNGITFKPQLLDFHQLVVNSFSVLKHNAQSKSIYVDNRIDSPIQIHADYSMLETVVRNLINNSIKFTSSGGRITLLAFINEGNLHFSVSDTGVGIAPTDLEKLFLIDSNLKTRGTNNERGTGLGLVICKEFIGYHQGEIWAESTPGKGSVFHFEIPLA